jgi:8-oxo-dGTP pyrophosphatase MutT (NUDIX family)
MLVPAPECPVPKSGKTIQQVAALPLVATSSGLEFVLITSRNDGRWLIPRGWPEDGERLEEGAAREAREEAGIVGDIRTRPIGIYDYMKLLLSGQQVHSNVSVFLLVVRELQKNWPERGDRKRRQLPLAKAARRVGDKDLGRLLRELDGKCADDLKAALKG